MGFEQHITCDGPGCKERVPYDQCAFDNGRPEGWLTLREVPGSAKEDEDHEDRRVTHDFCSLQCLAQWAAKQVGQSLVKFDIMTTYPNVAAAAACWPGFQVESTPGTPARPTVDISMQRACWPHDTSDWSHME